MSRALPPEEKARRKQARDAARFDQLRARLATERIVTESGCWEWTGSRDSNGYGVVRLLGRKGLVHRLSAHFSHGLDLNDTDTIVRHHCDNPPCFNPDHIAPGTYRDNWMDAIERGRSSLAVPRDRCPKGHTREPSNVKIRKSSGFRQCRICAREWQQANQAKYRKPYVPEPVTCECGSTIMRGNLSKHLKKSPKHRDLQAAA